MKNIMKHSAAILMMGLSLPAAAQASDIKIEGAITDSSTGLALPGARVSILNGEGAAMSGENGLFAINVPGEQAILRIEVPGYEVRYVPASTKATMQISLNRETSFGFGAPGSLSAASSASAS